MAKFTDCAGNDWTVKITVTVLERVKALTGVHLGEAWGGDLLQRLEADPLLLFQVLYAALKPDVDAAGLTSEQLSDNLAGDELGDAAHAMVEALLDFCPSRLARENLRRLTQMNRRVQEETLQQISKRLESESEAVTNSLVGRATAQFGTVLESAGSTQAPGVSVNSG